MKTTILLILISFLLSFNIHANNSGDTDLPVEFVSPPSLLGPDQYYCQGDSINVTLDAGPGVNWQWSPNASTRQITFNTSSLALGPNLFRVDVGTSSGHILRDTILIHIVAPPMAELADNNLCLGDSTLLYFTGEEYGPVILSVYASAVGGTLHIPMTSSPYTVLPLIDSTFIITGLSHSVCSNGLVKGDSILTVGIPFEVNLGNDQQICRGDSINLSTTNQQEEFSYLWIDGSTGDSIGTEAVINVNPITTTAYTLVVTDTLTGCTVEDEVIIYPFLCNKLSLVNPFQPRPISRSGEQSLKVFPNPFAGEATVEWRATSDDHLFIQLYNSQGQLVKSLFDGSIFSGDLLQIAIDANELPLDVYTLYVIGEKEMVTRRLILQR